MKPLRDVASSWANGQQGELAQGTEGLQRAGEEGGIPEDEAERCCRPGSWLPAPWGQAGVPAPAEAQLRVAGGFHPLCSPKLSELGESVTHGKGLSPPLKMGCDLLQSLSFGFRDTGQSKKDTEDAEGRGEPEGTIGPEHVLQRREAMCDAAGRERLARAVEEGVASHLEAWASTVPVRVLCGWGN